MPDRVGNELQSGDWVMISDPEDETSAPGLVLEVIDHNRYRVQLDPDGPPVGLPRGARPDVVALVDQAQALMEDMRSKGFDPQDPFEVDGEQMEALETEEDFDP